MTKCFLRHFSVVNTEIINKVCKTKERKVINITNASAEEKTYIYRQQTIKVFDFQLQILSCLFLVTTVHANNHAKL